MPTYIYKDEQQQGPYGDEYIEMCLNKGMLSYDDLCWKEGWEDWKPLAAAFTQPILPPPPKTPPATPQITTQTTTKQSIVTKNSELSKNMKLKLKNDSGMIREVPTGFSWTGFFFQYFVLFARGLFGRAFLLMTVAIILQLSSCVVQCSAGAASAMNGVSSDKVASAMTGASLFSTFVVFLPFAIIIGLNINKWTARYWLDHGYKAVGSGWKKWGTKWGLDQSSLPSE